MVLNELIEMYENYAYYVEKNIKLPKASWPLALLSKPRAWLLVANPHKWVCHAKQHSTLDAQYFVPPFLHDKMQ